MRIGGKRRKEEKKKQRQKAMKGNKEVGNKKT